LILVATRCYILKLNCTKFNFDWGSAPDPTRGTYSAPSDFSAGFKRTYFYGRNKDGRGKGREGRKRKEKVGGTGWKGDGREGI